MSITVFCRKIDAPRAETPAERRGESRSAIGVSIEQGAHESDESHNHERKQQSAPEESEVVGQGHGGQESQTQIGP